MKSLAACMGVSIPTIRRFINTGMLAAELEGTSRIDTMGYDNRIIKKKNIRKFLINYTAHVDHGRCDKFWLFGILSGNDNSKG